MGSFWGEPRTEDYEDCDAVGEREEFIEQVLGGVWRGFLDVGLHFVYVSR